MLMKNLVPTDLVSLRYANVTQYNTYNVNNVQIK